MRALSLLMLVIHVFGNMRSPPDVHLTPTTVLQVQSNTFSTNHFFIGICTTMSVALATL